MTKEGLEKLGTSENLYTLAADLSDQEDLAKIVRLAQSSTGRVDVLINNAGWFPVQPFLQIANDDWSKVLGINLIAPALLTRAVLPLMTGRGWGRLINIGSGSVYGGVPGQVHYVAAKAGVIGMTRSLAREFGHEGITANVVAPGLTMTAKAREVLPVALQEAQIRLRSIKREEVAADLVGTVFFLASPDSDFVTGQTIVVDGGNTML
jgi:3-oxoacyl-[acyl-carrier protein] reductase